MHWILPLLLSTQQWQSDLRDQIYRELVNRPFRVAQTRTARAKNQDDEARCIAAKRFYQPGDRIAPESFLIAGWRMMRP
jgi:hypothetical protein